MKLALLFVAVIAFMVHKGTPQESDPQWVSLGSTDVSQYENKHVSFSMRRNSHQIPRLEELTCTFVPANGKDGPMYLWTKPYLPKHGFFVNYSHNKFHEILTYNGDIDLVEIAFLINELTEEKCGTYRVQLKFENDFRLNHSVKVSLREAKDPAPETTVKHNLPIWATVVICIICTGIGIVGGIAICKLKNRKKKTPKSDPKATETVSSCSQIEYKPENDKYVLKMEEGSTKDNTGPQIAKQSEKDSSGLQNAEDNESDNSGSNISEGNESHHSDSPLLAKKSSSESRI